MAGERTIKLFDNGNGTSLGDVVVDIPAGESRILIDKVLSPSDRIFIFIDSDPRLYKETDAANINFPYLLGDYGQLIGSANGDYNYFYDWELEATGPRVTCEGERAAATLVVDFEVGISVLAAHGALQVVPNPASTQLEFAWTGAEEAVYLELLDVQGRVVFVQNYLEKNPQQLDVSEWARGLYFARVFIGSEVYFEKILLQ